MRTWARLQRSRFCGHCGTRIQEGDPALVIQIAKAQLIRCEACAEEEAPPLPPLRVVERVPIVAQPVRRPQSMSEWAKDFAADFKHRQAGE